MQQNCTTAGTNWKNNFNKKIANEYWQLIFILAHIATVCQHCLQDNWPTNQLAVSQVADWITRRLVN